MKSIIIFTGDFNTMFDNLLVSYFFGPPCRW